MLPGDRQPTRFYWLVLAILCTQRIAHLLSAEDGPWDASVRLRQAAGNSFWGELLDCFSCLSLWVAAPVAAFTGESWKERILLWPALSAGAILLEQLAVGDSPTTATYIEEETENDGLLRREETGASYETDATS
jgi:hypothetical protein